jgi:hypothetical protein
MAPNLTPAMPPTRPAVGVKAHDIWNIAINPLYLTGVTQITRTIQATARDRTRMVTYLPLWASRRK